MIQSKND